MVKVVLRWLICKIKWFIIIINRKWICSVSTYFRLKLITVDNASTDGSLLVATGLPRFENKGVEKRERHGPRTFAQ